MGMVDTALSGHLASPAMIGAVGVGALIFSFLFWGFGFLRLSTGGLTAQARGAGEGTEIRMVLARAMLLAGLLAALLLLLQAPIGILALDLVAASESVTAAAQLYFSIRIWAAPATLTFYCMHGWLLGMQDARAVMVLTLSLQGLNAALSCLFVLVLDWGIAGIAAGTLLAEYLAVAIGVLLMRRHLRAHPGGISRRELLDRRELSALVGVNANLMIRTFALLGGIGLFTRIGAQFGDITLAANQLLMQLMTLAAYALDGLANAAEALVGFAKGAGSRQRARQAIAASFQLAALISLGFALAYALLGGGIMGLLTQHLAVLEEAERFLPWMVAVPLVSTWCFILDGVFIGAMRTVAIRNAMLGSLAVFWLAQELLVPLWGNHGLWLAFLVFLTARGITLGLALPGLMRGVAPAPSRGRAPRRDRVP